MALPPAAASPREPCRVRDLQRIEPDHALHRAGDRCGERGRGGVGKGGGAAGDPVAPERGGKRLGHGARRRGDVEGQAIGGQRARRQALSLQGGSYARHLGDPGGEALGELGDAQIVVIQGRAGRRDSVGVRGQRRRIPGLERHGGVDHRGARQRTTGARARRDGGSAADAHHGADRPAAQRGGRGDGGEANEEQQNRRDERGGEAVDDSRGQAQIHGGSSSGWRATPSRRAACCQGLRCWCEGADRGAVSRMNRSRAATSAAASSSEAPGATIESFGRRFIASPKVSSAGRVTFTGS